MGVGALKRATAKVTLKYKNLTFLVAKINTVFDLEPPIDTLSILINEDQSEGSADGRISFPRNRAGMNLLAHVFLYIEVE